MTIFFSLFFFLNSTFAHDKDPELRIEAQSGHARAVAFEQKPEENISKPFEKVTGIMASVPQGGRILVLVETKGSESPEFLRQAKELAHLNGAQLTHTIIEKSDEVENFTRQGVALRGIAMTGVYLGVVYIANGYTVSLADFFYSALGGLVSAALGVTAPGYLKFLASDRALGLRKPHEEHAPLFAQLYKDFIPAILLNILMNQLAYQILGKEELSASRLLLITLAGIATETVYFIGTDRIEKHVRKSLTPTEIKNQKVEAISASNRLIFALLCTIPQVFECIKAPPVYFNLSMAFLTVGGGVIFAVPSVLSKGSIKLFQLIEMPFTLFQSAQDAVHDTCVRAFSPAASRIRRIIKGISN